VLDSNFGGDNGWMVTPGSDHPPEDDPGFDPSDRDSVDGSFVEAGSIDPTTGVWSASVWDAVISHEAARLKRYRRPVSVVAIAIERVDGLVDALGSRVAGNYVRAVAATLGRLTAPPDLVARSDDGPFLVLLAGADEPTRLDFARRLQAECDPWLEAAQPGTRLSIQGATLDPEQTFDVAVRIALDAIRSPGSRAQTGLDVRPAREMGQRASAGPDHERPHEGHPDDGEAMARDRAPE
jgi:GGDEF domain-containing protein